MDGTVGHLRHGDLTSKVLCAVLCLVAQSCPTLCDSMDCSPPGSSVHGDSPDKNTGVGCHALLQVIFPTEVSRIAGGFFFLPSEHHQSPRILECVAHPFSWWTSWPRNRTGVSCIAGGFFTKLSYQGSPQGTWPNNFPLSSLRSAATWRYLETR